MPGWPCGRIAYAGVNPFCSDTAGNRSSEFTLALTTRSSHSRGRGWAIHKHQRSPAFASAPIQSDHSVPLAPSHDSPARQASVRPSLLLTSRRSPPPPPPSSLARSPSPSTEIDATRGSRDFSLRLATARVTSLSCYFLSFSVSPFRSAACCVARVSGIVASREKQERIARQRPSSRIPVLPIKDVFARGEREREGGIRWISG